MCGCGHDHAPKVKAEPQPKPRPQPKSKPYMGRNFNGAWKKTPGRLFGTGFVRLYQLTLSGFIGNSCRHLPTCSEYTYEAIARYGLWSGGWMGLFRLMRCGPFGTDGFDPVPQVMPEGYSWYKPWRYWLIARKTKA